jgi:hypothetical protein
LSTSFCLSLSSCFLLNAPVWGLLLLTLFSFFAFLTT